MKTLQHLTALALLFSAAANAQIATSTSLVGTVTDSSGKTVAGAKVTAVNTGTLDAYTATTSEQGSYRMEFVRVGTYSVTVERTGFQKIDKTNVVVDINQVVRTDFSLTVGALTQSITIEASASVIKTDDASVSEIIGTREVADLPLNGRDPLRLANTTPGVILGQKATNGTPPGEDFIGAGTREIQNSISLDGISIVQNLTSNTPTRPMVEAIQEVEVQTGTYSAQYGAYMGVHMNVITKSGTNALHGNLVEFLRNDKLDARPYFLNPTAKKNPLRQNQYGFELDGPIIIPKLYNGKDKTFFMGSYEGLRQIRSSAGLATLITPQMLRGDFSAVSTPIKNPLASGNPAFPGNIIPASLISPIALKVAQYLPQPTGSGLTNNFSAVIPNNNNTDQTVDRIDQNLGAKIRLFFRYQRQQETLLAGANIRPNDTTVTVYTSNFSIGYTHTLTPTIVNDARFGRQYLNTGSLNYFTVNNLANAGTALGIPGFNGDTVYGNSGIPDMNINGFTGVGNGSTNWFQDDTTWQGADQLSWTKGAHTIMAGVEFRKLITGRTAVNSGRGIFNFTGQFSGYGPADFLLGIPSNITTPVPQIHGIVAEWRDGFFVLDNWQVSRKITVNYGLRYELPTVPYTVNGVATELNPQQTMLVPANPPVKGFHFIYPNHKDFAPRLGIAFRLTDKTVFRGGYGIYYNPNQTNSFTFLNTNPPFSPVLTYTSLPTTPQLSLTNPIPSGIAGAAPAANVITDNWNLPTAYMNQWSFGIERQLWRNSGLELQYLGSHAVHLDRNYFNNTPLPGPGLINPRRPNQAFAQIRTVQNDVVSSYEGLSVVYRQRMFHGLQMLASYTWAHTLDVSSDSNGGGTNMNPYNWRQDYGNSNWDIRNRAVVSFTYDIPFFNTSNAVLKGAFAKWQLNNITTLQSGIPFNVSIGTDRANTSSGGTQRPDLVGKPSSNCGDGHLTNCIDASAFALPALYTYGNAGRNLLHGPHLFTSDVSLFKNFPVKERIKLQFRAEFFNFTNSPEFSNPGGTFGTGSFGTISSTSVENRDIQFGLKLAF